MRSALAFLTLLLAACGFAQVRSAEPLAPGLPFTGRDDSVSISQVSADGKVVLYYSGASNLTPERVTSRISFCLESLSDGVIHRIPLDSSVLLEAAYLSGDGSRVAINNDGVPLLYDRAAERIQNIGILPDGTVSKGYIWGLSTDGTKILMSLNDKYRSGSKLYIRDTVAGRTTGIQTNSAGDSISVEVGARLTGDGKSIFFRSSDARLPKGGSGGKIYRKSLDTGAVELIEDSGAYFRGVDATGKTLLLAPNYQAKYYSLLDTHTKVRTFLERDLYQPKLSGDGTIVIGTKVTRLDDVTGTIVAYHVASRKWTTVRSQEKSFHTVGSISDNGSRIVYAGGLCDLNAVEYPYAQTNLPGFAYGFAGAGGSSDSGTKVVFGSRASNVVDGVKPDGAQLFVRDVVNQTTSLESMSSDGQPVRGIVSLSAFSANGRYLSYIVQRGSYDNYSFVVVVRDVIAKRNVASYEYFGRLIAIQVKNDGRTAVMFENLGVKTSLFDPKTGKVSDLTKLMPPGYNNGVQYLERLWVGADDDLVFLSVESEGFFEVYILQINVKSQQVQLTKVPANSLPIDISTSGTIAVVRGFNGSFDAIHLDTKVLRRLPINDIYATAYLSGNGRYVGINRFIIDLEEPRGWYLDPTAVGSIVDVLNSGDPIFQGFGSVNGVHLSNRSLPFLLRLGTPDPNPLTFVTPAATIVKGVVKITTTGVSFSEPTTSLKFQHRIGTGAWTAPGPALTSLTLPKDGVHEVAVRCVDSAGRMDPTPATFTVTSDTVAPSMTVNIKTTSDGAKFTATASEHCTWTLKVNYTFDGVEPVLGPWYEPVITGLRPRTTYLYELTATDKAGFQVKKKGTFTTTP